MLDRIEPSSSELGLTSWRVGGKPALASPPQPGVPRLGPLPVKRTERLLLRPFRPGDFHALHAIMSAPESFVFSGRDPLRPAETWMRLRHAERHWRRFGFGPFAVEEIATGALIGEVGHSHYCRHFGPSFDGAPEASWTLARASWGRGFALEAALASHQWLLEQMAFERAVCVIVTANHRSTRLAERLGYRPMDEVIFRGCRATTYQRVAQSHRPPA